MEKAFVDAECHEPDDITLLCGTCHQMKTGGSLSLDTVKRWNAHPKCLQDGFSRGPFDIGPNFSELVIGTISCNHMDSIITVFGDPILHINRPEQPDGPMRLNATLSDTQGVPVMQIIDNEWRTPGTNWDVFVQGRTIAIRRAKREIIVAIRVDPPNRLLIERLHMFHRGVRIDCEAGDNVQVTLADGELISTPGMELNFCATCIDVSTSGVRVGPLVIDKDGTRLESESGTAIVRGFSIAAPVRLRDEKRTVQPPIDVGQGAGDHQMTDFLLGRGTFKR